MAQKLHDKNSSYALENLSENSSEEMNESQKPDASTTKNEADANSEDEEDDDDEEEDEDQAEKKLKAEDLPSRQVSQPPEPEITSCSPEDVGNPEKDPKWIRKRKQMQQII